MFRNVFQFDILTTLASFCYKVSWSLLTLYYDTLKRSH